MKEHWPISDLSAGRASRAEKFIRSTSRPFAAFSTPTTPPDDGRRSCSMLALFSWALTGTRVLQYHFHTVCNRPHHTQASYRVPLPGKRQYLQLQMPTWVWVHVDVSSCDGSLFFWRRNAMHSIDFPQFEPEALARVL